jgi:hypothetical protein
MYFKVWVTTSVISDSQYLQTFYFARKNLNIEIELLNTTICISKRQGNVFWTGIFQDYFQELLYLNQYI